MRNMIRAALIIGTLATPMLAAADAPKAKAPAADKKADAPATDKKVDEKPATVAPKKDVKAKTTKTKTPTKKDAAPATK